MTFSRNDVGSGPLPPGAETPKGLHKAICSIARAKFADTGEWEATFFIVCPGIKGRLLMVAPKWESEEEKARLLYSLRMTMLTMGATHYSMISEIWIASVSKATSAADRKKQPMYRDDRREGLVILTADRTGQRGHQLYPILRRPNRKGTLGRPELGRDYKSLGGRMSELLMPEDAIMAAQVDRDSILEAIDREEKP